MHGPLYGPGTSTTVTGTSMPPGTPLFKTGSAGVGSVTTTMTGMSLPSAMMFEARALDPGSGEYGPLSSIGVGRSATKDMVTTVGVTAAPLDRV